MKAIEFKSYGAADVLHLADVEKPVPKDDEVLIRVFASSINSWDLDLLRGDFANRMQFGLRKPKVKTLGADIAGRVEAVGQNVTQFKPGDEVWGDLCESGWGGMAEYVCAPEKALVPKPVNMTFEQAAAVPQAALLAWQAFRRVGGLHVGQKVLINGAGGGVGTYAVQMAKAAGAEVTAVDQAGKLPMLRSLGADHVIDCAQEDFTANGKAYDLILDVASNRSVFDYVRALEDHGAYVTVGGRYPRLLQIFLLGPWIKRTRNKQACVLAYKVNQGLDELKTLIEAGKFVSVVDGPWPLNEAPEAFRHFERNAHKGKVVIAIP
jgi:NADPH:quinone reductase-like Zn-dependent oxidoreductase